MVYLLLNQHTTFRHLSVLTSYLSRACGVERATGACRTSLSCLSCEGSAGAVSKLEPVRDAEKQVLRTPATLEGT